MSGQVIWYSIGLVFLGLSFAFVLTGRTGETFNRRVLAFILFVHLADAAFKLWRVAA